jgi:hypothetical protein
MLTGILKTARAVGVAALVAAAAVAFAGAAHADPNGQM